MQRNVLSIVALFAFAALAADPPKAHQRTVFHSEPRALSPAAKTSDWTSFLGPTHNMRSPETKLLAAIPAEGPTLLWEMRKGTGYSAPAVAGNRLVYLHRLGDQELIECLRPETGEPLWQRSYPTTFSDRYGYNNGPRASAVIDGERVYTYGAQGILHSLELASGAVLWRRNLAKDFKVPQDFFGTATTPLVEGDLLVVAVGAPGGPTVVALDKTTGETRWRAGKEWGPSYASPFPLTLNGKRRAMVFAGGESRPPTGGLLSIDPASGKLDFAFPWRSKSYESVNASTPLLVGDDRILISASYKTGAALLRIGPDFKHELEWTSPELDLHWTSAVEHQGHLYGFAGRNEPDAGLVCLKLSTGETVWRKVLEWSESVSVNGAERTIYGGPLRGWLMPVDGRFLALGEHGHLMWLALSPTGPKILSKARLFLARESWTPPVLSRGLLYVAQNTRSLDGTQPRLLCYDLRGK